MLCRRAAVFATASLWLAGLVSPLVWATPNSWLIDPAKFHVSAHGQLSCTTCHDDVASNSAHPDPQNVDRPPARPDAAAGCLLCHDSIQAALALGKHGRLKDRRAVQFQNCFSCHNPHTVIKVEDRESRHVTIVKSPQSQCGACHAARKELPKFAADDARCMSCHEAGAAARARDAALCFHCHGDGGSQAQIVTGRTTAPIDAATYARAPHGAMPCATCHAGAAAFGHAHQPVGACLGCHAPHYSEARDPHANVDCTACHLRGGSVALDAATGRVVRGRPQTHAMLRHPSGQDCRRCHFDGNRVGASAVVLPAKGVLCAGCHAATLSVNDAVTIPALLVFLLGLAVAMSLWLSGTGGLSGWLTAVFSPRVRVVLRSLLVDTVFQRRLFRQSRTRWAIHSLIFLPIVFRFVWGGAVLVASWMGARGAWFEALVDRDHPVNAFLFDVTGLSIIVGICAAIARGIATRRQRLPGLPGKDYAALALIGGAVVVGFVLEGMRMAMTGVRGGAAFLGHAIGLAFAAGPALERSYGYVWYFHAALAGAFVAYLPFSRMFHVLAAPVVLAGRALREAGDATHAPGASPATGRAED